MMETTIAKKGGFSKYPAYKDSGVTWLGEIPAGWEVRRLKHVLRLKNIKESSKDSDLVYVGMENIESRSGRYFQTESEVEGLANRFERGNILFGKLRPYLAKVYLAEFDGLCSTEFLVYASERPRFFHKLLLSPSFINLVDASTYGSKMPRASSDWIGNQLIPIPPDEEQLAIAAFLDDKTAKIDQAISQKERLIALLKERKQIIIQNAVTKGLDPAAKMKDSGVDWIGEIPEGWEVKNLRYAFRFLNHKRVPLSAIERESRKGDYPYYGASGIIDYVDDYLFEEETILIAEDGANLLSKSTPLAFIANGKYWVNNHAHILKPTFSGFRFWASFLSLIDYTIYISGAAQPKLSRENLGSVKVIVPPDNEINSISMFIETQSTKIDASIALQEKQIGKLKEYKATLIDSMVTGKVKVTGVKP